ncbi:MAG: hypothetical protein JWO94_942 [Verrucomicrobiaceae bacterium]|nr:hypothetical protein [Verrucomicrobiaceae bacterium]
MTRLLPEVIARLNVPHLPDEQAVPLIIATADKALLAQMPPLGQVPAPTRHRYWRGLLTAMQEDRKIVSGPRA